MISRLIRSVGAALFFFCLVGGAAQAHPLGNFTINHLSELGFHKSRVTLRYVLDMAEIPTFQAMREVSDTGKMSPGQMRDWAAREARVLVPQLHLASAGRDIPFTIDGQSVRTRPGAGGLPLLYLVVDAHAALANGKRETLTYSDGTFSGRIGWKDVVVAPATEPTRELLAYPSALIGSPRDLTTIDVALSSDGRVSVSQPPVADAAASGAPAPSAVRTNQLSDMLARGTSDWTFVLLTFLVAIALGALHALEPGHGKTLLAISLVGARATVKQAGILAAALTIAHTIGVIALGVAINVFKGYFVPEAIYPWITLLSGAAIAVIGARAVQRQIRANRLSHTHQLVAAAAHVHGHGHDHGHDHDHDHDHGHAHPHTHAHDAVLDDVAHAKLHAIPGSAPLTFGGTVWAAMSGGVAPCPAALVVLLAAMALNEVTYGIFVIVAFSFGLAATLTGLGIGVVRGASWLQSRRGFERFVRFGPLVSAVVISTIGAFMVGQGFAEKGVSLSPAFGIPASQLVISLATAFAIAAFALSSPFARGARGLAPGPRTSHVPTP
jgi:ABC-type nickel/cobalt efflux system permease component RcnA